MDINPIVGIGDAIGNILNGLDKLFTSDEEKIRAETAKVKQELEPYIKVLQNAGSQIELAKIEAKHPSVFVAGARPAILWVFALGLFYQFLLHPLLEWMVYLFSDNPMCTYEGAKSLMSELGNNLGLSEAQNICAQSLQNKIPPKLDMSELWPMISGMLGLAGWRTWEKRNGVARENMKNTI